MSKYDLLTIKEVAELLKLNTLTVYEYVRKGELTAIKLGRNYRIVNTDFDEFITAHRLKKQARRSN